MLKGGSRKILKKFIENVCKSINFDLPKLEGSQAGSYALLFARFCLENLALFDVSKLEDVALITNALENIVLKHTGPSVGVAIETEMPIKVMTDPQLSQQLQGEIGASASPAEDHKVRITDARLLQITRACVILQMMWETRCFVRRAYNLHNLNGGVLHKDYQKPAVRNNLISGKELWEHFDILYNSFDSRKAMMKRCYEFAELLEVDKDARIGDDEQGDDPAGYVTPDEAEDEGASAPTSGRGRKRKSSVTVGNTPKKPRGRLNGSKPKKRNSKTPDLDGWD